MDNIVTSMLDRRTKTIDNVAIKYITNNWSRRGLCHGSCMRKNTRQRHAAQLGVIYIEKLLKAVYSYSIYQKPGVLCFYKIPQKFSKMDECQAVRCTKVNTRFSGDDVFPSRIMYEMM